jgi:division protein CdvB (Snf7/Vps24/ESCRT-III family)
LKTKRNSNSKRTEIDRGEQLSVNNLEDHSLKKILDIIERISHIVIKLDHVEEKFSMKYKLILTKITEAYTKHETTCACVFAYDLVEIRKISILLINSKTSFEQIIVRLTKASETPDVVLSLKCIEGAMRKLSVKLVAVFPETDKELGEIAKSLSDVIVELNSSSEKENIYEIIEEEGADKILNEAIIIAKHRIKEKFPTYNQE